MRAANFGARSVDGRRLLLERRHDLHEPEQLVGTEAGADLACVAELPVFVDAENERTKGAALVRRGPADQHELLALDAFGLHPAARARTDIFCGGELRDDALEACLAEAVEQLLAIALYVIRVANVRGFCRQDSLEPFLAVDQRQSRQILAVELQQVEGEIINRVRSALERA